MNDIFHEKLPEDELRPEQKEGKEKKDTGVGADLDELRVSIYNEKEKHAFESNENKAKLDTQHEIGDLKAHIKPRAETYTPHQEYDKMDEKQIADVATENRKLIESNMKNSVNANPYIPSWLKERANG